MTIYYPIFPKQADLLITGGHVLCMDEGYLDFKNGAITVTDGRITVVNDATAAG